MAPGTRATPIRTEDASGQPAPPRSAPDASIDGIEQSAPARLTPGALEDDSQPGRPLSDTEADLEDEREQLAQLTQEELESRIDQAEARVKRKRQERQLIALRREIRDSARSADDPQVLPERLAKRRRLSDEGPSRSRGQLRPAEPVYYYGRNTQELEGFLTFWLIHLQSFAGESEATRVNIAASYLRDTPMKMWGKRLESPATRIDKWEDFKQWLRDTLKAPNQRTLESTLALKEMKQRQGQSAQELYVYMTELESNIPTMSDEQRRAWQLVNALNPGMRSRVVRDLQSIDTVEAVLACAGRNESTEKTLKQGRETDDAAKSKSATTYATRKRFGRDRPQSAKTTSMDVDEPPATRERGAGTDPRVVCYNCNKKGHKAVECRQPRKDSSKTEQVPKKD